VCTHGGPEARRSRVRRTSRYYMYHGYYRRCRTAVLYTWPRQSQCIPRAAIGRGFPQISVSFLHASCARGAGLTVYPPSRTLEPLAFNEYCRFDTSAFV
jgi:hypothetical protein